MFCALTETWLKDQMDAEINIEGYTPFRQDRKRQKSSNKGRDSGGTLLYLRNDLASTAEPIIQYTDGVIEIVGIHIKSLNMVIIVVYRQPDDDINNHRSTSMQFGKAMKHISEKLDDLSSPSPDIFICGDFNLPNVKWSAGNCKSGASGDEKKMLDQLMELADAHFLLQHIDKVTHKKGNTLDLVLTNNPELVHSYQCVKALNVSDHFIIEGFSDYNLSQKKSRVKPVNPAQNHVPSLNDLNFYSDKTNWKEISAELNAFDWGREFKGKSVTEMMKVFLEVCYDITNNLVPRKIKFSKTNQSNIPRERKNLMRRRARINKQLSRNIKPSKRERLTKESIDVEYKLINSHRKEKKDRESKACEAIKVNSKFFFSYAKSLSRVKTGIGPLIDAAKNIISCPQKMANVLADQYNSVFSTPKESMKDPETIFGEQRQGPVLEDIRLYPEDIESAIDEIGTNSAAGPDGFPAILLKTCKASLSSPLAMIWRESLDSGSIPDLLKSANIVPIHKGGCKGTPKNYRPVALTSHLIKVFEKVLRAHIVAYMEDNSLFNPHQHGFRAGRSCLSQLVAHLDNIIYQLEQGKNVDVVYLDFSKAFDKVDFAITLKKLNALGIKGKIGRWVQSFITGRTQSVLVNGSKSTSSDVKSGVPQGSVLGPLLFLVLLGDIDHNVAHSFVSSFADDSRITKAVNDKRDTEKMQSDLDTIYRWTEENNMALNDDKFECLRYGPNMEMKNGTSYKSNTDMQIEVKEHVKDLGIIMSSDYTFKEHISQTVSTAKSLSGWILRTFSTRDPLPMMTLWKTMVLPKLDYCCTLWNPIGKAQIQSIELVQRSFLRRICALSELSYWDQLKETRLYSVERRRERYFIIYTWKVLEGIVPNVSIHQERKINAKWTSRHDRTCHIPTVKSHVTAKVKAARYSSLGCRGPQLFNTIPAEIRNITHVPVDKFKKALDKFLSTVPDEPQIPGYTMYRRADTNSLVNMANFGTWVKQDGKEERAPDSSGQPRRLDQ